MKTTVKPGDVIRIGCRSYTIGVIYYVEYYGNAHRPSPDDGWMIEFKDTGGGYHYWKQYLDGGELIPAREF